MTILDKTRVIRKRHMPKFRYNHDVLPFELGFGASITMTNNEDFERITMDASFLIHFWQVSIFRPKGFYYQYD